MQKMLSGKVRRTGDRIACAARRAAAAARRFWNDERGMGTVEIILIIVVLVGLVIIFRTSITRLVTNVMATITEKSSIITE